jgi:quercetin dioxygenase-like cupin family protein
MGRPHLQRGVVARGSLEVTVGRQRRILKAADASFFEPSIPHRFRNLGTDECEVVSVSSPPTFNQTIATSIEVKPIGVIAAYD